MYPSYNCILYHKSKMKNAVIDSFHWNYSIIFKRMTRNQPAIACKNHFRFLSILEVRWPPPAHNEQCWYKWGWQISPFQLVILTTLDWGGGGHWPVIYVFSIFFASDCRTFTWLEVDGLMLNHHPLDVISCGMFVCNLTAQVSEFAQYSMQSNR